MIFLHRRRWNDARHSLSSVDRLHWHRVPSNQKGSDDKCLAEDQETVRADILAAWRTDPRLQQHVLEEAMTAAQPGPPSVEHIAHLRHMLLNGNISMAELCLARTQAADALSILTAENARLQKALENIGEIVFKPGRWDHSSIDIKSIVDVALKSSAK